ncbi:MAG: hypothetical protein IT221_05075, partial [Fluviicola sp.]|nr:hypothetical protein [Fluviicola sp.]
IQKDTLIAVKHYFSNGQLMYEGKMKNGKADGVWKWYHHDGKLWGLGKYSNGLKEGRWLYGDLEKIRYLADVCVQESIDIDELIKEIQVTKIIYEKGEIIDNGSFNYSMENNR